VENNRNSLIVDFCKKGQTQQLFEVIHRPEDFKFLDERQNSLLNIALKNGQWQTAIELVEAGFDYYQTSHPAIISACQYANDDIQGLELLVKLINIDINAQNHQQRTALMTSCLLGHINKAKFLLANNADINLQDNDGNNELIDAIHSNNNSLVDLILSKQPKVEQVNKHGQSALHIAMMQKKPNEEIVKKLLDFGYDPELNDHQQNTAWLISSRKHPKIQKLISKHLNEVKQIELPFFTNDYKKVYNEHENTNETIKPSIEKPESLISTTVTETLSSKDSIQPEEKEMQQGQLAKSYKPTKSLFKEPQKNLSSNEEWFLAAKIGNLGKLNGQIINGIDIDCKDSKGCTALIRASGNKRRAVVSFLLQQNADIEIRSNNGSTALSSSIIGNCRHVAGLLLDKGADPNGFGPSHYSYATLAAAQWNEAMLSILYRYKADIHLINQQKQNLAHIVALAAEYYQDTSKAKATIMFLQDHGVDLNLQDNDGNTPLLLLCGVHKKNYPVNDRNIATIAHQIIKLGATPVLSNTKGVTALDICRKHKLMQTKGVIMNALSWNEF
jgi:ankyrin repeat protein